MRPSKISLILLLFVFAPSLSQALEVGQLSSQMSQQWEKLAITTAPKIQRGADFGAFGNLTGGLADRKNKRAIGAKAGCTYEGLDSSIGFEWHHSGLLILFSLHLAEMPLDLTDYWEFHARLCL